MDGSAEQERAAAQAVAKPLGRADRDAIEALKTRRSLRVYREKAVPRDVLEEMIDCARLAPTGNNQQPWEFVVTTDAEMRHRIADTVDYGSFIADAPACVVLMCKQSGHYLEDAACAATCLMLAAHAHGLGACWVHCHGKAYEKTVGAMLQAPAELRVICAIAVGSGDTPATPPKRDLSDVLHWETFA